MIRFSRRSTLAAFAALALTACGQAETGGNVADVSGPALTDIVIGEADAPITIVEYASWTCPACLQFHTDVIPMLKSDYVETGKVKFIFREFPTPPQQIAVAGFSLARCSGAGNYQNTLDSLFGAQTDVLNLVRSGGDVEAALRSIADQNGISGGEFDECLSDTEVRGALVEAITKADAQGVNATPTVFMNGQKLPGYDWRSADGMKTILDAELAELDAE